MPLPQLEKSKTRFITLNMCDLTESVEFWTFDGIIYVKYCKMKKATGRNYIPQLTVSDPGLICVE